MYLAAADGKGRVEIKGLCGRAGRAERAADGGQRSRDKGPGLEAADKEQQLEGLQLTERTGGDLRLLTSNLTGHTMRIAINERGTLFSVEAQVAHSEGLDKGHKGWGESGGCLNGWGSSLGTHLCQLLIVPRHVHA